MTEIPLPADVARERFPLHSWYFEKATHAVKESGIPETQQLLSEAIEKIDREGTQNLTVYRSKKFDGTAIPVTSFSLQSLYGGAIPMPKPAEFPDGKPYVAEKKHVVVVFPGLPPFPDTASPFTAWDIVYDNAIRGLSRTIQPTTEVLSFGSPLSPGGEVSSEWVQEAGKNALDANGRLFAEYIAEKYGSDPNTVLEFHGMSYGGGLATTTAAALEQMEGFTDTSRIRLLIDNPAGYHKPGESRTAGVQTAVGFVAEGVLIQARHVVKKSHVTMEGEKKFYEGYKALLQKKGFKASYSADEERIRKDARDAYMKQLLRGSDFTDTTSKTYTRKGLWDPTTFRLRNIIDAFRSWKQASFVYPIGSKGHAYAINSGHFINRYRVDRWHTIAGSLLKRSAEE